MVKSIQVPTRELRVVLDPDSGSWPAWCTQPPKLRKDISGLSNQSYLVTSGSESFVIRIHAKPPKLGVDRLREKNILLAIQDKPFSPDLVFWHKNYLVTRFVPNILPHQISSRQLARLFSQIHQTQVDNSDPLDVWDRLHDYFLDLPSVTKTQSACLALMQSLKPPDYHKTKFCLCHNDMLNANLLRPQCPPKTNRIIIIDWEYAQLGHPAFDLAVYAETCQLDDAEVAAFLQHYNGDVSAASLQLHRILYRLIELLWWQTSYPEKDMTRKFDRLHSRLEKFVHWSIDPQSEY